MGLMDVLKRGGRAFDGLVNTLTGQGTRRDKSTYSKYMPIMPLNQIDLESFYVGSWLARRVVDCVAEDLTREWLTFKWDGHQSSMDKLDELQDAEEEFEIQQKVTTAICWDRLCGGGAIVLGTKGQDLSEPLILDSIGKGDLDFVHVYERWYASPTGQIDYDVRSRNYNKPLFYTLGGNGMDSPIVHWSRLARFEGSRAPYNYWVNTSRWGMSVLQAPHDAIRRYESAAAAVASLTQEASVDVFRIKNFFDKIGTEEGEAQLKARFELVQLVKSINRAVLLDFDDDYTQKQPNFGSLDKVLEEFRLEVCGASGTPMTVLFGQSPGGMNATGEHDEKNYNRRLMVGQNGIRPALMQIYRVLTRSTFGEEPKRFKILWNPLTQLSDTEQAQAELDRASADEKNIVNGIIAAPVATKRLKRLETYPDMTDDDVSMVEEMSKAQVEQQSAGASAAAEAAKTEPGERGETTGGEPAGAASGDPKDGPAPQPAAVDHRLLALDVIRKKRNGYHVYSEAGKHLDGPFPTRGEAESRLGQIEYFKAHDALPPKNTGDHVVGRTTFQGLPIAIENRAGSLRQWFDKDGKETGSTTMKFPYGFLEDHIGKDKEEVDVYLGPDADASDAYVVHQLRAPDFKVHDEDKVMLGFRSYDEAKAAYLAHRNDGEKSFGGMTVLPMERFHAKLRRRTGTGAIRV